MTPINAETINQLLDKVRELGDMSEMQFRARAEKVLGTTDEEWWLGSRGKMMREIIEEEMGL